MPYASKDDMDKRFGAAEVIQITDRENLGVFNAEVFAQAQLDGDAEIDTYLQGSYTLPLAMGVPTILVRIACDLYRYYLYGILVPDHVKDRYNAAIALLVKINKGDILLNPTPQGDMVQDQTRDVLVAKATPVFTTDSLKGF